MWFARPIALGGLLSFVGALLYFAYQYTVVFGRETAGTIDSSRVAIVNVLLFTAFAMHHSLFARDAFRKRITRIVGALERSVYVWVASAMFVVVCVWWRPVPGTVWRVDASASVWVLRTAQLLGVYLTLRSALMIDFLELAGVRQIWRIQDGSRRAHTDPPSDQPVEFKTSGPYGWVRHPIYSGWFLLVFAVADMTLTRFVFAVTSSAYLLIAIPFEERSLRQSSSGNYDRYMREVPWKLVPRIF